MLKDYRPKTLFDKIDSIVYASSLIGQSAEEHYRTKKSIRACKRTLAPFWDKCIPFGQWLELQDAEKLAAKANYLFEV